MYTITPTLTLTLTLTDRKPNANRKWWDMYTAQGTQGDPAMPKVRSYPAGVAKDGKRFISMGGKNKCKNKNAQTVIDNRRGYYACVSQTDDHIGKVLDKVEALHLSNSTVVVLMSDHGYGLGEICHWKKMTNFEMDARIPLIIRAPRISAMAGQKTSALVEAVDLFPTLMALAGPKVPRQVPGTDSLEGLEGNNLTPILEGEEGFKTYAFSQISNCYGAQYQQYCSQFATAEDRKNDNILGAVQARANVKTMGYSVRSAAWRYTEWVRFDGSEGRFCSDWSKVVARELYEHRNDVGSDFDESAPTKNVVTAHSDVANALSRVLQDRFKCGSKWQWVNQKCAWSAFNTDAKCAAGCMDVWVWECMVVWAYRCVGCMVVWPYGFGSVRVYPLCVCGYTFMRPHTQIPYTHSG